MAINLILDLADHEIRNRERQQRAGRKHQQDMGAVVMEASLLFPPKLMVENREIYAIMTICYGKKLVIGRMGVFRTPVLGMLAAVLGNCIIVQVR